MKLRCTKAEAKFVFSRYSYGFTDVDKKSLQKKKRKAGAKSLLFLRLIAFFDGQWMNIMRGIIPPNLGWLLNSTENEKIVVKKKHHPSWRASRLLTHFRVSASSWRNALSRSASIWARARHFLSSALDSNASLSTELEEGPGPDLNPRTARRSTRNWQFRLAQHQNSYTVRANYMWEKVLEIISELDWIRTIQAIVITTPPIIS